MDVPLSYTIVNRQSLCPFRFQLFDFLLPTAYCILPSISPMPFAPRPMLYAPCSMSTKQIPLDEKEIIWHILCVINKRGNRDKPIEPLKLIKPLKQIKLLKLIKPIR